MATKIQTTANQLSELQSVVEWMQTAQLHISNLLSLAEKRAKDEMESLLAVARHYVQEDFHTREKIEAIVLGTEQEGGAA